MRWMPVALVALTGCPSDGGGGGKKDKDGTVPNEDFVEVGVGSNSACGLRVDGTIRCWGSGVWDREPPANAKASALAHGYDATCWIDADTSELGCTGLGTYTYTGYAQTEPPSGTFVDVGVGRSTACALDTDGEVLCWNPSDPYDVDPLGNIPPGPYTALAVGAGHAVLLRDDGTLETVGSYASTPPSGRLVQVAAGYREACATGSDGTMACWVDDPGYSYVADTPDATGWQQVAAGYLHSCGLADDGSVSCWGDDAYGQASPPSGTFQYIAAGGDYSCAVDTDGVLACWGDETYHGSPDNIPAP